MYNRCFHVLHIEVEVRMVEVHMGGKNEQVCACTMMRPHPPATNMYIIGGLPNY